MYSFICRCPYSGENCCLHLQARRLIFQFIHTRLHSVMSQMTIILTRNAVVTSHLILC